MGEPLFNKKELDNIAKKKIKLDSRRGEIPWDTYWKECKNIDEAHQLETAKRVERRAREFLNALLILIGEKGSSYIVFESAFNKDSELEEVRSLLTKSNTPENRRYLYTILKALSEIPSSWGTSAFIRFLRGNGKQKECKYPGAGTFGSNFGWKEIEVNRICKVLCSDSEYSKVLMSYEDVAETIREEDEKNEDNPDYEVVDYDVQFKATKVIRDKEFLNKLCGMLEKDGLAPLPKPTPEKPRKERVPKVFKPGDIIRKNNLRDLLLPAHVRIPIEKYDEKSKQWLKDFLEEVVIKLESGGYYKNAKVDPRKNEAFEDNGWSRESKERLCGATYLEPWKGKNIKNKELKYNFKYRLLNTNR